ncbi:MAG: DNA glycosylase [Monoraphidium minutum]|nr:MAG: DNA glycosylase [Monoraphidium minutum]
MSAARGSAAPGASAGSPPDAMASGAPDVAVAAAPAKGRPAAPKRRAAAVAASKLLAEGAVADAAAPGDADGGSDGGGSISEGGGSDGDGGAPVPAPKKRQTRGGHKGGGEGAQAGPAPTFSDDQVAEVRAKLLGWYDSVHRVLPWRRNPHSRLPAAADGGACAAVGGGAAEAAPEGLGPQEFAYRVWVSEIMLQQTQVATVIPYFQKWLARWPTVADLAAATQEDVNQQWAGLGYYRRARYLLEGARHVVEKLGGSFPGNAEEMRQIPGVGPYTAAAVASIAFGDAAAAVDGNVIRVVSRLRALGGDPTKNARALEGLAAQLLHPERPGCHNQAMMELGATVCRPTNPACGACPVAGACAAAARVAAHAAAGGDPAAEGAPSATDYPEKAVKAGKREQHVAVCVVKAWVGGGGGGDSAGSAAGGAGAPAAKRRKTQQQGSILAFLAPPGGKAGGGEGGGAGAASGGGESEEALARGGAAAWYLLVQRPAAGLLAGLWECPGVEVLEEAACGAGAPASASRRALADGLLSRLGVSNPAAGGGAAAGGARLVARRQLGSVVHVFSHIRQTSHVEQLVLAAPTLAAACAAATAGAGGGGGEGGGGEGGGGGAAPALRWVSESDLRGGAEGLTAGVRKVLALAHALGGEGGGEKKQQKGGKAAVGGGAKGGKAVKKAA